MPDRPTIACQPDGPYLVKGLEQLRDADSKALSVQPVLALCRCGGSASKPFCDGTHRKNGFSGARLAEGSADHRLHYTAGALTIHDNRSLCAHAGHCTDGLPAVFRMQAEPWIDAHGADAEAIVRTVQRCPSGALACSRDGVPVADAPREPAITVARDGPYEVVGGCTLVGAGHAPEGASSEHYTLCRCGASHNKPFCDGSHWRVGFEG